QFWKSIQSQSAYRNSEVYVAQTFAFGFSGFNCCQLALSTKLLPKLLVDESHTKIFGSQKLTEQVATEIILDLANVPGKFTVIGRMVNRFLAMNQRKSFMDFIVDNPQIADIDLKQQLIITGLPRTGSTLLQNLLSCDLNARSPLYYEMSFASYSPVKPPTKKLDSSHPWFINFKKARDYQLRYSPEVVQNMLASHYNDAHTVEEEYVIMLRQFGLFIFGSILSPEIAKRQLDCPNREEIYKFLQLYIKMLQSGFEPNSHWILKAPIHSLYLPTLKSFFPNSFLIFTHRHPKTVIGSLCKLLLSFVHHCLADRVVDRRDIGNFCLLYCKMVVSSIKDYKSKSNQMQYIDINYVELMKNPISIVERIYSKIGLVITEDIKLKMKDYLMHNPQGKHGRHKYCLDEYGLSDDTVEEEFRDYINEYGLQT
ncbi:hypothetical protein ROZALSC1DRAFT_29503, partial [Rozella allomycis CSF55]